MVPARRRRGGRRCCLTCRLAGRWAPRCWRWAPPYLGGTPFFLRNPRMQHELFGESPILSAWISWQSTVPTIRRDGVRIELVAGNAQQSCRFCRRPRSSHLQRADPSRLRYHEASNPGSYIGRVARTSASRRVLSDSSEAHGQTEIRPPRVEAISPGYLKTSLLR